jgi:hypothetical protein
MLAYVVYVLICSYVFLYVGLCWPMLAYVGLCRPMLAYVGLCWPLQGGKYLTSEPPTQLVISFVSLGGTADVSSNDVVIGKPVPAVRVILIVLVAPIALVRSASSVLSARRARSTI